MWEALTGPWWPILIGTGLVWFSGKCRGKNARSAFRLAGWGWWLLLLRFLLPIIPIFFPFNWLLVLAPTVVCWYLAGAAMLREMRAQQQGEFTDPA